MRQILCTVDFTENTLNMLRYVVKLNQVLKAHMILLHVYETPASYTTAKFALNKDLELFKEARTKLDELNNVMLNEPLYRNISTELVIRQGRPADQILNYAMEHRISLISMAASSLTRVERLIIGSNATRVIKNAPCMVLVIPSNAVFSGINSFVYATDLRPDNISAGKSLKKFAKKLNAEILRVHVKKISQSRKSAIGVPIGENDVRKGDLLTTTAVSVSAGLEKHMQKSNPGCLAVFHRARNIFGSVADASLSRQISFSCNVPVLVLHANDRQF